MFRVLCVIEGVGDEDLFARNCIGKDREPAADGCAEEAGGEKGINMIRYFVET